MNSDSIGRRQALQQVAMLLGGAISAPTLAGVLSPATRRAWAAGIHEMGTARMGRDPKTSVLNAHNQAHDVPNLFVTDGACMASSSCVNPSITYMALTARACDYAVAELKRGNV